MSILSDEWPLLKNMADGEGGGPTAAVSAVVVVSSPCRPLLFYIVPWQLLPAFLFDEARFLPPFHPSPRRVKNVILHGK